MRGEALAWQEHSAWFKRMQNLAEVSERSVARDYSPLLLDRTAAINEDTLPGRAFLPNTKPPRRAEAAALQPSRRMSAAVVRIAALPGTVYTATLAYGRKLALVLRRLQPAARH